MCGDRRKGGNKDTDRKDHSPGKPVKTNLGRFGERVDFGGVGRVVLGRQ